MAKQKVWKKNLVFTHQQRQLSSDCFEATFLQKFSGAGGTDQLILPTSRRHVGPSHILPGVAICDDLHCPSAADGTQKAHYITTGLDLDSCTHRFRVWQWFQTDFYTCSISFVLQTIHRDLTKSKNITDCGNRGLSFKLWMRLMLNSVTLQAFGNRWVNFKIQGQGHYIPK